MPEVQFDICSDDNSQKETNEFRVFFDGTWRHGKDIRQIVISLRYYQVSPTKTQS